MTEASPPHMDAWIGNDSKARGNKRPGSGPVPSERNPNPDKTRVLSFGAGLLDFFEELLALFADDAILCERHRFQPAGADLGAALFAYSISVFPKLQKGFLDFFQSTIVHLKKGKIDIGLMVLQRLIARVQDGASDRRFLLRHHET